jgi:hypothetical protein
MILTLGNRRTRRKTCPIATLSTKNPTWTDLGANPGLSGDRPATNRQIHGMAQAGVLTTRTGTLKRFWFVSLHI